MRETGSLAQFLADLRSGIVHLSLAEYNRLPARVLDARRIFESVATEHNAN